ncbi:DUF721 domain-containing protein [Yoonia sp. 2307UL14-13]|uniref:DUF721 domain-containing protein n=1 Tax=Yoonia sp. 2307UL14-13 TaxID=3126506 RepID=UPI003098AFEC
MKQPRHTSTTRGFSRASTLVQKPIRAVGEQRGFAVARLLTHWAEVVGAATANIAKPVNVSYGKGGMGATLTLLTTGSQAPMLEMQKEAIREKVNACYGYRAISRVRITQTAPTGFAEGRVAFEHKAHMTSQPDPVARNAARTLAADIENQDLRSALCALGANVLSQQKS